MSIHKTATTSGSAGEHALSLLRQMLLIRRFEEKAAELYSAGKIRGFLHLYIGEEAIAVGAMQALSVEDAVVATYREHGQALARGLHAGIGIYCRPMPPYFAMFLFSKIHKIYSR